MAQAGLVGVLVLAFVAVAVARLPGAGSSGALLAATPTVTPRPTTAPTITPAPTPTLELTPPPTVAPTAPPTAAPTPTSAVTSYRVVAGDTLTGIAARFGTTVQAIVDLNKLTTTNLRIGQLLRIPPRSG
jgi:LysM repeat protein